MPICASALQDEIREKYEDKLEKTMTGPLHHLIAKTFKVLSGKKVSLEALGGIVCSEIRTQMCSLNWHSRPPRTPAHAGVPLPEVQVEG